MADYDLAYKKISELTEDTSAPASGDWLVRHDSSAGSVKKVDATDAWLLEGNIKQSGGSEVTPLSSAA